MVYAGKDLTLRWAVIFVFLWVWATAGVALGTYSVLHTPSDNHIAAVAQKQLGNLDTKKIALDYLAQQAQAAGVVPTSMTVAKGYPKSKDGGNTLIYRINLVDDTGFRYVLDVTVTKGIYQAVDLKRVG